MKTRDYVYATDLANTMNWNMATEDFKFMSSLEPKGCLVLFDDSKKVGIATCISYGNIGWFGNLIVEKECRHRGAGSTLVTHAIDYLQKNGVQTIGLYAYPNLTNFYGGLGFKADEEFSVLYNENLGSITNAAIPDEGAKHLSCINKLDSCCFGGDRKRLLESIILEKGNLSYCVSDKNGCDGYIAATVYEKMAWVGPLVCQEKRMDVAKLLVDSVLTKVSGKSVYAVVPRKEASLVESFLSYGFREEFFVSRMFFGEKRVKNCIYLAESLERG